MNNYDWAALGGKDDRQRPRTPTMVKATLRKNGTDAEAVVWNMSGTGLMAETPARLVVGDHVRITIPDQGELRGWVAWVRSGHIGVTLG
jgi:hypothetical protein